MPDKIWLIRYMRFNNIQKEKNKMNEEKDFTSNNSPNKKSKIKYFRIGYEILISILFLLFFFASGSAQSNYENAKANYDSLKSDYKKMEKELSNVESEFSSYKEEMAPFEEMTAAQAEAEKAKAEQEKKSIEEAEAAKKAAEEAAAAQKAAEEEAARLAEEAKGYETGITYDQLARTPDDYLGKKVKFYGKVIQVIENGSTVQIRLAVNDDYDTILLGKYDSSIVSSRIFEDDMITIYGVSVGTITYQSTMGGNITIPGVSVEKIDQ